MVDKVSMTVILFAMRRDMKYVDDDDALIVETRVREREHEGD
jgi:hypothetical protein